MSQNLDQPVPDPSPERRTGTRGGRPAPGPILLVRLGAVGDVIRALPALDLLRRAYPEARVDWLVEERCGAVLKDHPDLHQVVTLRRKRLMRRARRLRLLGAYAELRRTLEQLRDARYAVVLDLQGTLKSALLARSTGCPVRIGLAAGHAKEGAQRFYTEWVDPGAARISRVNRNLQLLAPLGIDPGARPRPVARLPLGETQRAWAAGVLESLAPADRPRVLLYPGTSLRQDYKRWPADRFGFLAGRLQDDGVQALVAGGPGEEPLIREVCDAVGTPPRVVPRCSLPQLAAILERMDLFVGGDTGPMHLAWAAGTRVLGLFGATDPVVNAPYGEEEAGHRVVYRGPESRPYRVKGELARSWMEAISVEEVHGICREVLGIVP
jgi:lipopolysaccharide heptosyltransferase I